MLPLALAAALGACSPTVDNRGNIPLAEVVERIKPGAQSREQVREMLGTPSTVASFGGETWYYIGKRTETFAFFAPTVLEQKVLAIRFDKDGMVAAVRSYDGKDAREVSLVERETPTKGKELGFLEQIIGNIGRFSRPDEKK